HYFECSPHPTDLPPFPTRRSSDLHMLADELAVDVNVGVIIDRPEAQERTLTGLGVHGKMALVPDEAVVPAHVRRMGDKGLRQVRSEEHTSELQSLAYLVCRLLLEK